MTFQTLPFFLITAVAATAQTPADLRRTDVSWAAVVELVLPADPLRASADESKDAAMAVLKLTSADQSLYGYIDHSLNDKLWELASTGAWEAYADAQLTQPLSADEVTNRINAPDTTITYDPETYAEKREIVWDLRPYPGKIADIKVRQLLTYDDARGQFALRTLAVAPYDKGRTPFWLKAPVAETPVGDLLTDPDVSWAVRYVTRNASPQIRDFQVVKEETGPIMEVFFEKLRLSEYIPLYDRINHDEPLAPNLRNCLFACADTTVTLDPETNIEHVQIVRSGLEPDDVTDLELIQEWYFDEALGVLHTRLIAVAPRFRYYFQEGEWYPRVGFYRRCD